MYCTWTVSKSCQLSYKLIGIILRQVFFSNPQINKCVIDNIYWYCTHMYSILLESSTIRISHRSTMGIAIATDIYPRYLCVVDRSTKLRQGAYHVGKTCWDISLNWSGGRGFWWGLPNNLGKGEREIKHYMTRGHCLPAKQTETRACASHPARLHWGHLSSQENSTTIKISKTLPYIKFTLIIDMVKKNTNVIFRITV